MILVFGCTNVNRCDKEICKMFPSFSEKEYLGLVEFIDFSTRGELLETDIWIIHNAIMDGNYPICNQNWEDIGQSKTLKCSNWQSCPISQDDSTKFQHLFYCNVESESKKLGDYLNRLRDGKNYYAYVYDGGVDNYFMLYCPSDGRLYYTRRRGV